MYIPKRSWIKKAVDLKGRQVGMDYGDLFAEGRVGDMAYLYTQGLAGCVAAILYNPETETVRLYHLASDMSDTQVDQWATGLHGLGFKPWRLVVQAGGTGATLFEKVRASYMKYFGLLTMYPGTGEDGEGADESSKGVIVKLYPVKSISTTWIGDTPDL